MQKTEAIIRSVKDGTTLTFRLLAAPRTGEEETSFEVIADGPDLRARMITSTYYSGSPALLFRSIAQQWRGWNGDLTWSTLEGEFSLAARSDSLGHVTIEASLQSAHYPPEWKVSCLIHLEAGTLDGIWRSVAAVLPIAENARDEE